MTDQETHHDTSPKTYTDEHDAHHDGHQDHHDHGDHK